MANAKAISVSRPCKEINHASNSSHFVAIFKRFHDMKSNMELCDVALKAENVTFSAHRLVLAANSPYLKNIFLSENEEARCQEIILPKDVRCETVKLMLEYFYTGKLQVNSEDCEDMLAMACLLKVNEIIKPLQDFIVENLHASNCLRFHSLAHKLNLADLKSKIDRFVDWNFAGLLREPAFLAMSAEHIVQVVRSENLRVKHEETVYEAVYRWFRQDIGGRQNNAERVFKEIRFHQIPSKYLTNEVIPNLCDKHGICVEQVKQALKQTQVAGGKRTHASKSDYARKPEDVIYVISGRTNHVERYDPVKCACVKCQEMSPVRPVKNLSESRCAVVVGRDLYCLSNSKVEKFDILELRWTELVEGVEVHDSGVCAGKDCIFVTGGRQRGNGVCKLHLDTLEWTDVPEMATYRRSPGAAFMSGKLYVIGGHSPEGPLASAERYDTKHEKWSALKPLNSPRFLLGACALDGLVYVVGGRNNEQSLDSVEVYDPKTKVWSLLEATMQEARNDFGLAAKGSEIFCVGGRGVHSVECLNVEKKEWKTVGSTGQNNFSISCVFYPPL